MCLCLLLCFVLGNLTDDNTNPLRNGQSSPHFEEKPVINELNGIYNANNKFLHGLQKSSEVYHSKNCVVNHNTKEIEKNHTNIVDSQVNFYEDKLCLYSNQNDEKFYDVVNSDVTVKSFSEGNKSDNCDNIKSEDILNTTDNKENYANDRCNIKETEVFSKTQIYSNNLFSTSNPEKVNPQQSPNDYISTSTSRSKIGCDSTCNIGAVKSPIDSPSDSENRELSPDSGLQNSNMNNNNIKITSAVDELSNMDHISNKEPKKKTCSHLVEQLDYNLLKGKKGIDLLTAIEEQSNVNLINLERHTSTSGESAYLSSKEMCSPRKGRTRSVDIAAKPIRGVKRAHSADGNHTDVKLRKIDFKQYKKEKRTSTSSSKMSKHKEERKHSLSKSNKHDSKSRSSWKKDGHSSSSKDRHSSYRGDCKPRLLTNGNYSYPPEDVSNII